MCLTHFFPKDAAKLLLSRESCKTFVDFVAFQAQLFSLFRVSPFTFLFPFTFHFSEVLLRTKHLLSLHLAGFRNLASSVNTCAEWTMHRASVPAHNPSIPPHPCSPLAISPLGQMPRAVRNAEIVCQHRPAHTSNACNYCNT